MNELGPIKRKCFGIVVQPFLPHIHLGRIDTARSLAFSRRRRLLPMVLKFIPLCVAATTKACSRRDNGARLAPTQKVPLDLDLGLDGENNGRAALALSKAPQDSYSFRSAASLAAESLSLAAQIKLPFAVNLNGYGDAILKNSYVAQAKSTHIYIYILLAGVDSLRSINCRRLSLRLGLARYNEAASHKNGSRRLFWRPAELVTRIR